MEHRATRAARKRCAKCGEQQTCALVLVLVIVNGTAIMYRSLRFRLDRTTVDLHYSATVQYILLIKVLLYFYLLRRIYNTNTNTIYNETNIQYIYDTCGTCHVYVHVVPVRYFFSCIFKTSIPLHNCTRFRPIVVNISFLPGCCTHTTPRYMYI